MYLPGNQRKHPKYEKGQMTACNFFYLVYFLLIALELLAMISWEPSCARCCTKSERRWRAGNLNESDKGKSKIFSSFLGMETWNTSPASFLRQTHGGLGEPPKALLQFFRASYFVSHGSRAATQRQKRELTFLKHRWGAASAPHCFW